MVAVADLVVRQDGKEVPAELAMVVFELHGTGTVLTSLLSTNPLTSPPRPGDRFPFEIEC